MTKDHSKYERADRLRARCALTACASVALLLLLLSVACSHDKSEPPATKIVETNNDPDLFTMPDPSQFALTTAQLRKVNDELHVNGVITPDVNRSVPVVSLGSGRVVAVKAKLGDSVKKVRCCC